MRNPVIGLSRRVFAGSLIAGTAWPQAARPRITNLTSDGAVNNPYGLRIGPDRALYICEIGNHRISKLDLQTQKLTTVIDGQREPYDLRFDENRVLYFVDMPGHQVRSLDPTTGKVTVVAGTGTPGFGGDGGLASQAQLKQPHSIAFDPSGKLLICDIGNHRIRMVDRNSGTITTFAGTGEQGATPDGAARKDTPLNGPRAIDFDQDGGLYLVLREGNCVYRLDPKTDRFRRVAGTGEKGYTGDGGDARLATLSGPKAISCAPDGSVYIADTESHTIRQISRAGMISTVAGTGVRGDGPVGDPRKCQFSRPHGVFVDQSGTIFIGDSEANRVRKIG
jgi:DNA-binding beta-propeller fold protein YncE